MTTTLELFRQGRMDEIWTRHCGFIDLSVEEFMDIQERLLLEQIGLLGSSELGREILGGRVPSTVEEFRELVPLTSYQDYYPYLADRREDVLPRKPLWWLHTSGRSGPDFKWVPYTEEAAKKLGECGMTTIIFASCTRPGEFLFEEGDTMLYALAPFPYMSGAMARGFAREFSFTFLPPLEDAEAMEFQERIQEGFRLALRSGLDAFNGVASVLVKIGEQFTEGAGGLKLSTYLLDPRVLGRMVRGLIRSRLDGRSYLLPRDLWDVKCLGTGSTDTALFRSQIEEHWGRTPIEAYGATEATGILSVQAWNAKGLTFFPDVDFLEFIPEAEHIRNRQDPGYRPELCLLDEVEAGQRYELVITNFWGGVFTRYRVGDLIEIVSLGDEEIGTDLPQMTFYSRADGIIDLAAFTRLTEKDVWQAIEEAEVAYADWMARKEVASEKPLLHLYIEPTEPAEAEELREKIDAGLGEIHKPYAEFKEMLGMEPLKVTLLPRGAFARYFFERQKEGADLAQLKPPHMNASDEVMEVFTRYMADV
ncbi:MAG: GH3 family domain-containing protein [Chloroflexota bacterium]